MHKHMQHTLKMSQQNQQIHAKMSYKTRSKIHHMQTCTRIRFLFKQHTIGMLALAHSHGCFCTRSSQPLAAGRQAPTQTRSTHCCITTTQRRSFRRYHVHIVMKNVQIATEVRRLRIGLPRVWKTCIRGKMRVVLHGQ